MIQTQTTPSQVYTDLNGLQSIRKLGKDNKDAALMEVAKQFESMFLNMMLSSMRKANEVFKEDSLFSSQETEFYEQMYDDQLAVSLSSGQSMGIAQVMFNQMKSSYNAEQGDVDINQDKLFSRRVNSPIHNSQYLKETIAEVEKEQRKARQQIEKTPAVTANQQPAASGNGDKRQQFASPTEFVAALYPHAEVIGKEIGVEPKAIVAQAALETGWGKYLISDEQGRNSFNFFGIKADNRWDGNKVEVTTHEFRQGHLLKEKANFRSYPDLATGLRDYANFLQQGKRYEKAINQGLGAEHYGHALQQAGYATDPEYGAKIKRISSSTTLEQALQQLSTGTQGVRNDG